MLYNRMYNLIGLYHFFYYFCYFLNQIKIKIYGVQSKIKRVIKV